MDKLYDVCIIGAGPSGSYSAYLLASYGYKVLLLDKSNFPREKSCGGFLSSKAQRCLKILKCNMPIQNIISSLELYSHTMESVKWNSSSTLGVTILRKDFDNFIVNKAITQGVCFYDNISITKIDEDENMVNIYTSIGLFTSKLLIGADGVFSFTSKQVGLSSKIPLYKMGYTCSQIISIENSSIDQNNIEFYCIPFLGGFGWCFPIKNGYNIGVGASTFSYKTLHKYFFKFAHEILTRKNINISHLSPRGAFIPAGGFSRPLCKGRILLIGDAAGGVDPFSGEGLEHAFESAQLAVNSIHESSLLKPAKICYNYKEMYNRQIMRERRISLLISLASFKKGNLFFNLFKYNPNTMKGFEVIMTHDLPYNYIMQNYLKNINRSFFNIMNPWKRLNK